MTVMTMKIGASVRRSSGRRLGGRLLATTQWPLFSSVFSFFFPVFFFFPFFFPVFFSVATFSHRRRARIKKLIQRKLLRMPKNLGVYPFPDPVGLLAVYVTGVIHGHFVSYHKVGDSWYLNDDSYPCRASEDPLLQTSNGLETVDLLFFANNVG